MSICETFMVCSMEIFKWQTKQIFVNEESISDWLLYKLNDLNPDIKSIQFNRFVESKTTGADYELWVINHQNSQKYRIQAKRLRPNKDHYDSIAYTNQNGMQITKLLSDSIHNNFIPLYAFYNNEDLDNKCKFNPKNFGVFISDANELNDEIILKGKRFINSEFLIAKSIPIQCLFCCPLSNSNKNEFHRTYFSNVKNKNLGNYLSKNLPNYVEQILKNEKEELDKWFFKEFSYLTNEISGIIIVDNRKNKNIS